MASVRFEDGQAFSLVYLNIDLFLKRDIFIILSAGFYVPSLSRHLFAQACSSVTLRNSVMLIDNQDDFQMSAL